MTHICVLIGCHRDELRLWEDEDLGLGGQEGIVRAVLLHLHHVQTRLVFMQRLQYDHLWRNEITVLEYNYSKLRYYSTITVNYGIRAQLEKS